MLESMKNRFPGISCAYLDEEGEETLKCYGVFDKERNLSVNSDIVFPACSVSKFITTICVMRLCEQGLLDIDAPVNDYLRRWSLCTPEGDKSDATIRNLLCHTSGIVDGEDCFYGYRRGDKEITVVDILEGRTAYNNRPARAEQIPGTVFEYSDAGFCVVQLLVEEVTGKAFDAVAKEQVFEVLHLENTFFGTREAIAAYEKKGNMATGYMEDGTVVEGKYPLCPDLAAGALWSTPKELMRIAEAFLAALKRNGTLLREQSVREIIRPVKEFPWTGLGIFLYGEDTLVSKGWGENGQCMLKMICSTGEISVVMTNRNPGVPQEESGVEWMVDRRFCRGNED